MDTQQLAYFLALCDTLNYTTAAERCFISRQAMRQSVQALEASYGLSLIENRKNRLYLTPAGKLLQEKAQLVVDAYALLENTMRACRASSEPLRIGISCSLLPFYAPDLADAIERFPHSYPNLVPDIQMMPADAVIAALEKDELDAGIVVDTGALPLPFQRTVLREDPLCIILSAQHPLANRPQLTLADLNGLPLNLMSDPKLCFYHLHEALTQAGVQVCYRIVPEFYDVGCNIRDNHTVGMDRGEAGGTPHFAQDRVLPLENGRFTLHVSLLTAQNPTAGAQLLTAFLLDKP